MKPNDLPRDSAATDESTQLLAPYTSQEVLARAEGVRESEQPARGGRRRKVSPTAASQLASSQLDLFMALDAADAAPEVVAVIRAAEVVGAELDAAAVALVALPSASVAPSATSPSPAPFRDFLQDAGLAEDVIEALVVDAAGEVADAEPAVQTARRKSGAAKPAGERASKAKGEDDFVTGDLMNRLQSKRFEPMSAEEEFATATAYRQSGDTQARDRLVERNLRLAATWARKYMRATDTFADIFQEATKGLMRAIETYNPEAGRFSTYSTLWIRQHIQRYHESRYNLPRYVFTKANALRRDLETVTDPAQREEMTEKLRVLEKRIADSFNGNASLDARIGDSEDGDGSEMYEAIASEDASPDEVYERRKVLEKLLERIAEIPNDRDADIVRMRLGLHPEHEGEPLSLAEISEICGLSRERIRQVYDDEARYIYGEMVTWANGLENLPSGFKEGLLTPGGPRRKV